MKPKISNIIFFITTLILFYSTSVRAMLVGGRAVQRVKPAISPILSQQKIESQSRIKPQHSTFGATSSGLLKPTPAFEIANTPTQVQQSPIEEPTEQLSSKNIITTSTRHTHFPITEAFNLILKEENQGYDFAYLSENAKNALIAQNESFKQLFKNEINTITDPAGNVIFEAIKTTSPRGYFIQVQTNNLHKTIYGLAGETEEWNITNFLDNKVLSGKVNTLTLKTDSKNIQTIEKLFEHALENTPEKKAARQQAEDLKQKQLAKQQAEDAIKKKAALELAKTKADKEVNLARQELEKARQNEQQTQQLLEQTSLQSNTLKTQSEESLSAQEAKIIELREIERAALEKINALKAKKAQLTLQVEQANKNITQAEQHERNVIEINTLEKEIFEELDLVSQQYLESLKKEFEEKETALQKEINTIDQNIEAIDKKLQISEAELEQLEQEEKSVLKDQKKAQNKHAQERAEQQRLNNLQEQKLLEAENIELKKQKKLIKTRKSALEQKKLESESQYQEALENLKQEQSQLNNTQELRAKQNAQQKDLRLKKAQQKNIEIQQATDELIKIQQKQQLKNQEFIKQKEQTQSEFQQAQAKITQEADAELAQLEQDELLKTDELTKQKELDQLALAKKYEELEQKLVAEEQTLLKTEQEKNLQQKKLIKEQLNQKNLERQQTIDELVKLQEEQQLKDQKLAQQKELARAKFEQEKTEIEQNAAAKIAQPKQDEKLKTDELIKQKELDNLELTKKYEALEKQLLAEEITKTIPPLSIIPEQKPQPQPTHASAERNISLQSIEKTPSIIGKKFEQPSSKYSENMPISPLFEAPELKPVKKITTSGNFNEQKSEITEDTGDVDDEDDDINDESKKLENENKQQPQGTLTKEEKIKPKKSSHVSLAAEKISEKPISIFQPYPSQIPITQPENLTQLVERIPEGSSISYRKPVTPIDVSPSYQRYNPAKTSSDITSPPFNTFYNNNRESRFVGGKKRNTEKNNSNEKPYSGFSPRYTGPEFAESIKPSRSSASIDTTQTSPTTPSLPENKTALKTSQSKYSLKIPESENPVIEESQVTPEKVETEQKFIPLPKKLWPNKPTEKIVPELPELNWFQKLLQWIIDRFNNFFNT